MKKNVRLIYNDAAMEQKISAIRKTVKLHMNGAAAYTMQEMGLKYDQNYGVSIPDLRAVARKISPDKDLAIRLWQMNIREMKILATLLFPASLLNNETAVAWQNECNNIELIEQSVMNLFQHWEKAVDFSLECTHYNDKNKLIFGLLLAQRTYARYNAAQTEQLISKVLEIVEYETDMLVARYIGMALAAFCRKSTDVALKLKKIVNQFVNTENQSQQFVKQIIEQEIDFLETN